MTTGGGDLDPHRVAEVLVTDGHEARRRGSGYRVSATMVLTAAHVVAEAQRVEVRFDADRPDEWRVEASVAWLDVDVDAAVLAIAVRPGEVPLVPARFGRVSDANAVVAFNAMGFPRFKLRPAADYVYRDSAHLDGRIPVLSNRREGTLELLVDPPDRDPDPNSSPWEGMSGAVVLVGGLIVGVVSKHYRSDGLNRLAAARIDRWYERLDPVALAALCQLIALEPTVDGLTDAAAAPGDDPAMAGYLAQVADIGPDELLDRDDELAEVVRFCAGSDEYLWWQAGPWAGKSALAAWVVLHPPAGVTVVSFFVTGRLRGQADSQAYTEAMTDQLAALAGEPPPAVTTPAGQDRARRRLLGTAAARLAERGQRLLVVVDGLDEDEGTAPDRGRPSVASLLPLRPPAGVRVMVTSRPHPQLPTDVPANHPLRRCAVRWLAASPHATDQRTPAMHELRQRLHDTDPRAADVLGFLTAAGGGLTLADLAALTGYPGWTLHELLTGAFGRSVRTRVATSGPAVTAPPVFLFAHETLRGIAEQHLAGDLASYRRRIHDWADGYATGGWPASTPGYLLRPYSRLLAALGKHDRLARLAGDPSRHERLLANTYADTAALVEISTALASLRDEPEPDLAMVLRLTIYQTQLTTRNLTIPPMLPALWVRLGEPLRGIALARGIADPGARVDALAALIEPLALTDTERADRVATEALQTARDVTDDDLRAQVPAAIAAALARAHRWERAEEVAVAIVDPDVHARALTELATAYAGAQMWDRAEQTATGISDPHARYDALAALAEGLARAGCWDRAEQTAGRIPHQYPAHSNTVHALIEALAEAGQLERAEALVSGLEWRLEALVTLGKAFAAARRFDRAEEVTRQVADWYGAGDLHYALVEAQAAAGLFEAAEAAAAAIADPDDQAHALTGLVEMLVKAQRWDDAERITRDLRDLRDRYWHERAWTTLVGALTTVDVDRARTVAAERLRHLAAMADDAGNAAQSATARAELARATASIDPEPARRVATEAVGVAEASADSNERDQALETLAESLAQAGWWEPAERAARAISARLVQQRALAALVGALIAAAAWDRAEHVAGTIADPEARAEALFDVAEVTATVDADRARRVAAAAEKAARSSADPGWYVQALTALVVCRAPLDDAGPARRTAAWAASRAADVAHTITDPDAADQALAALVDALARAQLWDEATDVVEAMSDPRLAARSLSLLFASLADADPLRAERLATSALANLVEVGQAANVDEGTVVDPVEYGEAAAELVGGLAAARLWDHGEATARTIGQPYWRAHGLTLVAAGLVAVDPDRARGLTAEAEHVADSITDPRARTLAYAGLLPAIATVDADRVEPVMAKAQRTTPTIEHPIARALALTAVVEALAGARQWELADRLAGTIEDPYARALALASLAEALATVDAQRARRTAVSAEQAARSAESPLAAVRSLTTLATALTLADPDRAGTVFDDVERAAGTLAAEQRAPELSVLAEALVRAREWPSAERVAGAIEDPDLQAHAWHTIVRGLVHHGETGPTLRRVAALAITSVRPFDTVVALSDAFPELTHTLRDTLVRPL